MPFSIGLNQQVLIFKIKRATENLKTVAQKLMVKKGE